MYVDAVNAKDIGSTHISVHNFLNIQPIFNLKKFWKAQTEGFQTIPSNAIYVDTFDTSHKISNAFNAMYFEAVNTFSTQYTYM